MAMQICSAFLTHNPFIKFSSATKNLLSTSFKKPSFAAQNCNLKSHNADSKKTVHLPVCLSRRQLSFSGFVLLLNGLYPGISKASLPEEMELERYTDSKEGFTLLRPSSWIKVDKAGATVLFEEANKGSNNVGVVVNPVRLTSLGEYGTPQLVADKLLQAEKRNESTIDAELIGVAERSGQGGLQVYEFEYKVDSSRGETKRIFSAAFVTSRKLHLLNITHSDKPESPRHPYKSDVGRSPSFLRCCTNGIIFQLEVLKKM